MKLTLILPLLLLISISINLIEAVPPVQTTISDQSLQIAYPQYKYVPINANFTLYIHVYNITNYITGNMASCYLDLYNPQEVETCHIKMINGTSDYYIPINKGNFSMLGEHSFIIQCNSSTQTGFANGIFEVTKNGNIISSNNLWVIIVLIFLSSLSTILGFSFEKDKFILRSVFYLVGLLFGLLALNSTRIAITQSSSLESMNLSGLIILIPFIIFFFLYIFIIWTVNTFKQVKDKKELRWQY